MAYSASALSFMLQGLRKPVIFTGSQLPIGIPRTDGRENLISALMLAAETFDGEPAIQEVAVYFGNHLMRGNRTHKESAQSLQAIVSPNHPPLVEAGWSFSTSPRPCTAPQRPSRSCLKCVKKWPGCRCILACRWIAKANLGMARFARVGLGDVRERQRADIHLVEGHVARPETEGGHGERHAMRHGGVHPELYASSHMLGGCGVMPGYDMTTEAPSPSSCTCCFHRRPRRHPRTHDPKPAWRIDASAPHHSPSAWTGRRQWPRF